MPSGILSMIAMCGDDAVPCTTPTAAIHSAQAAHMSRTSLISSQLCPALASAAALPPNHVVGGRHAAWALGSYVPNRSIEDLH